MEFYVSNLQTSLKINDPITIKLIHNRMIKSGIYVGVLLMNNLVNAYAKTGFINDAHKVFDEMPEKDTSSYNTLMSAYAKQGRIKEAVSFFNKIPVPDSVSWTSIIVGYNQLGRFDIVFKMFLEMVEREVVPSQYTITSVLASCASIKALDTGRKVHSFVVRHSLLDCVSVANSLVNMYAKSGDLRNAWVMLDTIKLKNTSTLNAKISLYMQMGCVESATAQFENMKYRDIVSWNSMIAGCNQHGLDEKSLGYFLEMLMVSQLKPDHYTITSVLSACANLEELEIGKQTHAYIIRNAFDTSGVVV